MPFWSGLAAASLFFHSAQSPSWVTASHFNFNSYERACSTSGQLLRPAVEVRLAATLYDLDEPLGLIKGACSRPRLC